jgi:hypothetical protein
MQISDIRLISSESYKGDLLTKALATEALKETIAALDAIYSIMAGQEWSSDTTEAIGHQLAAIGYPCWQMPADEDDAE